MGTINVEADFVRENWGKYYVMFASGFARGNFGSVCAFLQRQQAGALLEGALFRVMALRGFGVAGFSGAAHRRAGRPRSQEQRSQNLALRGLALQ